jgi:radical SAM superfamily enzyme YgiQ (UPF0313 family)
VGLRVAILCIDPWEGPDDIGFRPFNYAARKLLAAFRSDPTCDHAEMEVIESRSRNVDEFVQRVEAYDPDIVGASTYVWSFSAFLEVARRLKARRPERTIVFGGPSARPAMFDLSSYRDARPSVDALVLGDGEQFIRDVVRLKDHSRAGLATLPGLAVNTPDGFVPTGAPVRLENLDDYPSPYELGMGPPGWSGQLETFRGCPVACRFCQWGDPWQTARAFSADYLTRQLEGFRAAKLTNVFLVDAGLNLNASAFRNLVAAEERTSVLSELAFRGALYPTLLKPMHVEFLHRIHVEELSLGIQSFEPETLRMVDRPFDERRFAEVMRELTPFNSIVEIILGLPGDGPAAFRRTLDRAMEVSARVRVYRCLVLPDALMTRPHPGTFMRYDEDTLAMIECTGWEKDVLDREWQYVADLSAQTKGDRGYWWYTIGQNPSRCPAGDGEPSSASIN